MPVSIFIELSIFMAAESFFIESASGAGAIAGAAAVSGVGVSSFVLHAASASTAATRARRFIYVLLEGDDQRCHGPRTRYQDRGQNLPSRSLESRPANVVQVQGQQCLSSDARPRMQGSSRGGRSGPTFGGATRREVAALAPAGSRM